MNSRSLKAALVLFGLAQLMVAFALLAAVWHFGTAFLPAAAVIVVGWALTGAALAVVYRRYRRLQESSRRLRLLAEMSVRVNREILLNEDIELIYSTILNYLFNIFDSASTGSVLILGDDGHLTFAASRGFTEEFVSNFHLKLEDSFLYQVTGGDIQEARLITHDDFQRLETVFKPGKWEYRTVISAPLFVDDRLFGLLNLDSAFPNAYNASDVEMVERFRTQIEMGLLARERYTTSIKRYQVDALTGLFTRRYFEDLFKVALDRAVRHQERFVVAMFDVDGLKHVNDTYGHLAGDRLLLSIATVLQASCRTSDIIGRVGGDEIMAVYHQAQAPAMEKSIAAIHAKLRAKPLRLGDAEYPQSFSYGLARFPEDGTDLESLTAVADKQLYAMKTGAR